MKKILLRADDLGYCKAVNYGIEESVKNGIVRSVGLMPNMEHANHGVGLIINEDIAIGQHTNICVGKPISDPSKIPSLVDKDGFFKKSSDYRNSEKDIVVKEEVIIEIEAQYQRFLELAGRKPDYFEGHAVFSPTFFEALEEVALKHDLKYSGFSFDGSPFKIGNEMVKGMFIPSMLAEYRPKEMFIEEIEKADTENVLLAVFHPGYLDDYILNNSSLTINRTKETAILCDPSLKKWLEENEIIIVDYREI